MNKSARDELVNVVNSTGVMRQVLHDLEDEPLRLLCTIYQEFQKTGKPVPDHRLTIYSYFSEAALRAVLEAEIIKPCCESRYSLYEYEFSEKGLDLCRRLAEEGYCGAPG